MAGPLGSAALSFGPAFLHVLFPSSCASCGAPRRGLGGGGLCRACWRALPRLDATAACASCALPGAAPLCRSCLASPPPIGRAAAVAPYEGVARRLVHALKFRAHDILAAPAAALMADAARSLSLHERADAVVPVPSTPRRNRERGYDPAALLALEAARRLRRPFRPLLARTREGTPQSSVPAAERRLNVRGAFAAAPRARALRLLLVDDVMTTGATAFEAARALQAAGAAGVDLLLFARTPEVRPARDTAPEAS